MATLTERRRIAPVTASLAALGMGMTRLLTGAAVEAAPESPSVDSAVVAPAMQLSKAFAAIAEHVKPCVVSVYSKQVVTVPDSALPGHHHFHHSFAPPRGDGDQGDKEVKIPVAAMGSGMILDHRGHIITNYHVIKGGEELVVQISDGSKYKARVVGADPDSDVAVIEMLGNYPSTLPVVTLGDSDSAKAGEMVIAIGAPFGLKDTVTQGIIGDSRRADTGISKVERFIQTDAPLDPGNSGGPLIDMKGEVIGMNTAIATNGTMQFSGVGFAVPSNAIKAMLPALLKGEKVVRGDLGLVIMPLSAALEGSFGLSRVHGGLVSQVKPDSPAAKAGIKRGDVIVRYNGKPVEDDTDLRIAIAATPRGTAVDINIMRDMQPRTLTAVVE